MIELWNYLPLCQTQRTRSDTESEEEQKTILVTVYGYGFCFCAGPISNRRIIGFRYQVGSICINITRTLVNSGSPPKKMILL